MKIRSSLLATLLLGLLAGSAGAQVLGFEILNDKIKKKYAKFFVTKGGRQLLCGEPVEGLLVMGARLERTDQSKIAIAVVDPARPDKKVLDRRGTKALVAGGYKITLKNEDFNGQKIARPLGDQTLIGLRKDYLRKSARLDDIEKRMSRAKKGSREWFALHRRASAQLDGLISWCDATLFPLKAEKLRKDAAKLLKKSGKDASESRLVNASKLSDHEVPKDLVAATRAYKLEPQAWHARKSQHMRIIATGKWEKGALDNGLLVGERVIEGFRTTFIDPLLGEDDTDPIPEGHFDEYFLGPDNEQAAVRFFEEYYGGKLGQPREKIIKIKGWPRRMGEGDHLEFWRCEPDQFDLDAVIAHRLGHILANYAFNGGKHRPVPAWIGEGFGAWTAFEAVSRDTCKCMAFDVSEYGKQAKKEGQKDLGESARETYITIALEHGAPMDQLMRMSLVEMKTADLTKAWSLVDWMVNIDTKRAVDFLSAACRMTDPREKRLNLEQFRPEVEKFLGGFKGDAYRGLEKAWRKYAEGEQKRERRGRFKKK